MQKKYLVLFSIFSVMLPLCLLGCGGKRSFVPVEGTVTMDGVDIGGAVVSFLPVAEGGSPAAGECSPRGSFTVQTGVDEGCVPGEYRITVTKYQESTAKSKGGGSSLTATNVAAAKNLLPAKYASPDTSGLTATVKRGMEPLVIKLEK